MKYEFIKNIKNYFINENKTTKIDVFESEYMADIKSIIKIHPELITRITMDGEFGYLLGDLNKGAYYISTQQQLFLNKRDIKERISDKFVIDIYQMLSDTYMKKFQKIAPQNQNQNQN